MHEASTSGSTGQKFASSSWLTNHYLSKSPQLIRHITSLPIYPGDRVLDLGCGIGFYMEHFLQMVGSSGEVVGIDHDPALTAIARKNLQKSFFDNWDIATADLFDSAIDFSRFNKIVLFNGLSYQKDLFSKITSLYKRLSVGSLLIIKDFDMATSIYNPIDKRLHGELIEAVKKEISVNPDNNINKFVGSALHGLSRKLREENLLARFGHISTRIRSPSSKLNSWQRRMPIPYQWPVPTVLKKLSTTSDPNLLVTMRTSTSRIPLLS